jgi:hemoglobin
LTSRNAAHAPRATIPTLFTDSRAPMSSEDQAQGPTPYEQLGGERGVRALVDRFYDLMDLEPRFAALRAIHPTTLEGSRDKLFWFLSGWLGGPDLYQQQFGHPRLRMRHFPYAIGVAERDAWLDCMRQAMREEGVEETLGARLQQAFGGTADWMRNRAEPGQGTA